MELRRFKGRKTGRCSCCPSGHHYTIIFISVNLSSVGRLQFSSLRSDSECFLPNMLNPSTAERQHTATHLQSTFMRVRQVVSQAGECGIHGRSREEKEIMTAETC